MTDAQTIELLNGLFAATANSPLVHLADSAVFLSSSTAEDAEAVREMMAQEREHVRSLAEVIVGLGGAPRRAPPSAHMAELHYLELRFLLPRLLRSKEKLAVAYGSARAALSRGGSPGALEVVSRIEAGQRRHVETLRGLLASQPTMAEGAA